MNQKLVSALIGVAPTVGVVIWLGWRMWRLHRHHRRFMAVSDELDKAIVMMGQAKDQGEFRARAERAGELLEHLNQIRQQKP